MNYRNPRKFVDFLVDSFPTFSKFSLTNPNIRFGMALAKLTARFLITHVYRQHELQEALSALEKSTKENAALRDALKLHVAGEAAALVQVETLQRKLTSQQTDEMMRFFANSFCLFNNSEYSLQHAKFPGVTSTPRVGRDFAK